MSRYLTKTNLILAAITLLAAFFRLYRLDTLPPGFQFDQAFYVFDVIRLLQGQFHIFFAAPGGTEPLYPYLAMPAVALFGDQAFGLRLTGAIIGILTIPAIYWFAQTFFRSTRIGLLAAFLASISLWHIFFNRYGERVSLLVLLAILMFQFYWRALSTLQARNFILTGVFTALALYTYPGSRVLPIALIALTGYMMIADRKNWLRYFEGLLVTGGIALIIFAPLGIYFVQHPEQFASHSVEVSIFAPHGNVTVDVGTMLVNNAIRILGMFFVVGDGGVLRNPIPGRPIFDPVVGGLFVVGVIVWLTALFLPRSDSLNRRCAVFIGMWLGAILSISLITDDAPNFVRTLPAMPAVMILVAWGASEIWERLRSLQMRYAGIGALLVVLMFSGAQIYRDYFISFAENPATYYTFDTDKVELAEWIKQTAKTNEIYLAPLLAQNGTISLLTRNVILKSFESRDTVILPDNLSGKDAFFVFPWEQDKKVQTMSERLGTLGARQDLAGSNGGKLAILYRVPAQNLPDLQNPLTSLRRGGDFVQPQKIERAAWNDEFELLGYSVNTTDPAERNLEVTIFFHALKPMTDAYSFSVKVRDAKDRTWGQEDKWLGNNSYATTTWSPGDVIIEKFYPGLNACAPAGEYQIAIEAYNPQTMQTLGGAIALGATRADVSPGNLYEHLEPAQTIDVQIAPQARLLGYSLTPAEISSGEEFSLALFWRGAGNGIEQEITLRVRDARQMEFTLTEPTIRIPADGRGLCSLFDSKMPVNAAAGEASIWVNQSQITTARIK